MDVDARLNRGWGDANIEDILKSFCWFLMTVLDGVTVDASDCT